MWFTRSISNKSPFQLGIYVWDLSILIRRKKSQGVLRLSTFPSADFTVHWRRVRWRRKQRSGWESKKKGWGKPHGLIHWQLTANPAFSPPDAFIILIGSSFIRGETDDLKQKKIILSLYLLPIVQWNILRHPESQCKQART